MATAAPHVKLLRQLASAKDDYLSGAFDISWDGAKATLYLVFGRPSHAVFDTDQAQIEGEAAIDALLAELPRTFVVSDWRRAMSPQETLSISIDELAGPFVRLAGSYADDPVSDENPEWWSSDDSSPDLAFGLADFPLLPGGRPLWAETSPENVNLAERLAELPPSILILTGAKLRAAAVVSGGDIIDAVWIDDEDQARGEAAGMAILGATKGTLAGYALDDPRVAEALTMLWRLPLAVDDIEMAWLDPASMLAAFRSDGLDRVLVIDAPVRGIALFSRGGLVAVYSETQRSAVASPERLRSLLSQAKGRLTVMERVPRPMAAGAAPTIPSAVDFFSVVSPEPEAEAATAPETDVVADDTSSAAVEPVSDEAPVTDDAPVSDEAPVTDDAPVSDKAPVSDNAPVAVPVNPYFHPFLREHPLVPAAQDAEAAGAAEPVAGNSAVADVADTEPTAEAAAHDEVAVADGETAIEPAPASLEDDEASTEASAVSVEAEQPDAAAPVAADDEAEPGADQAAALDATSPPPPPPAEAGDAVGGHHAPPPPAPEAAAEPGRKGKRPWWAFGTRRRSSRQAPSDADRAAAEAAAAQEAAEAAASAGWGIRQPDASAPPPWARPRDYTLAGPEDAAAVTETPPPAAGSVADETATQDATPTWSTVERGATVAHDWAPAGAHSPSEVHEIEAGAVEAVDAVEPAAASEPSLDEPEAAATEHGMDEPEAAATEAGVDQPVAATESGLDEPEAATEHGMDEPVAATEPSVDEPEAATEPSVEGAAETEPAVHDGAAAGELPVADVDAGLAAGPGALEGAAEDEPAGGDTVTAEPASAAAPAWSAREVIKDSVSWYRPPQQPEEVPDAPADTDHDAGADGPDGSAAEANHEADHETEHETVAAADDEREPLAETEHWATFEGDSETAHDLAADAEQEVPAGEDLDHDHEHSDDLEPAATLHPETEPRDFWAEFATPDPDAPAEDVEHAPESLTASDLTADAHDETEAAPEAAPEPAPEPVTAEDAEPTKRKSSERTFAPWNWPLAEAETPARPNPIGGRPASMFDEARAHLTADASTEPAPHDTEPDTELDTDGNADQGFFQRDEPVGSQFVDFDEVRKELVQIGVVWLGERNAVPVTALLTKTRSTIDDFVATIDTIRGLHVEGQDPASIQAMAREMHQQAAERLCGA